MFDDVWSNYDAIYPEFAYKQINWDSLRAVYRPRAVSATTAAERRAVIAQMLGELRDVHAWFVDPSGNSVPTYTPNRFVNWQRSVWDSYMASANNHPQQQNWGYATLGGAPYLYFGSWNRAQIKTDDVDAALEQFRNAPAMIIDVRPNGGGDESLARDFATRFYDAPHLYRYGVSRDGPARGDLGPPSGLFASPRGAWQFRKPVLLLIGRGCFSGTEDFVMMMRLLPNVTIVGDTTGGGSGNPGFHDLGAGWQYTVPRSMDYTPDMQPVEWRGLAPSIVVPMNKRDLDAGRDPVLDYAIGWALRVTGATTPF